MVYYTPKIFFIIVEMTIMTSSIMCKNISQGRFDFLRSFSEKKILV